MDLETRVRQVEALNLLTNRVLMDMLSLQVDSGAISLDHIKSLLKFSAQEVLRGAPQYKPEVDYFSEVMADRFDETFSGTPK
jgi:hypothetical protein